MYWNVPPVFHHADCNSYFSLSLVGLAMISSVHIHLWLSSCVWLFDFIFPEIDIHVTLFLFCWILLVWPFDFGSWFLLLTLPLTYSVQIHLLHSFGYEWPTLKGFERNAKTEKAVASSLPHALASIDSSRYNSRNYRLSTGNCRQFST